MNMNLTPEQLTTLTTTVELALGMEMYDPDPDFPEHDTGLTYEGLETLRNSLYQVRQDNSIKRYRVEFVSTNDNPFALNFDDLKGVKAHTKHLPDGWTFTISTFTELRDS